MKKLLTTLLILLIATASYAQTYTVERVIDGDTIKLTNGERVRLIGIDTPESKTNDKAKRDAQRTGQDIETINKMGQEATEFLKMWDLKEVMLEFDVQKKDKYGRLLAYVYKEELYITYGESPQTPKHIVKRNGKTYYFLNAYMIEGGYATPMTISPNVKYAELFKALHEKAKEEGVGLWANEYHSVKETERSILEGLRDELYKAINDTEN